MRRARRGQCDGPVNEEFLKEVREGFAQPQKSLSPKWLYDEHGSELFEAITKTEDYYVTRTEAAIMEEVYTVLPRHFPPGGAIAEFGSGAGIKSRRLLAATKPSVYVSIDVAAEFLKQSCAAMRKAFPETDIHGVVADFSGAVDLPQAFFDQERRLGFFPGSTIGNFEKGGAQEFLAKSRQSLGDGSQFLLGADLVKDEDVLLAAYDDSEGLTRRFMMNVLKRMKDELGAELDESRFEAVTLWNPAEARIEMGVMSKDNQAIQVGEESFTLEEGEMIHFENSHKYTEERFTRIAADAGWTVEKMWTDEREWFGVFLLKA